MAKRRKAADRTPAELLASLAAALNDCEKGGVRIRLHHGAVFTHFGAILPPAKKAGWEAKVFGMLPESPGEND